MQRSFAFGPFVLDSARGTLTRDGAVVPLGTRSLALLGALLRAGNGVVDKWELMEAAWPHAAVEESNLSVQIAGLRKLLGNQPDGGPWIVTVARAGYRFAGTIEESDSMPAAASRPLVSVLPLVDASAGRDSEILAATLREDIAAALVSFRWLRVTQRGDAAAKYEVHGSLREAGPLRLAIRVTDTKSGTTLLARTFEAGTAAASDDLPRRIAAAIEPTLLQAEGAPGRGRSAVDHVRSGIGLFHRLSPATHHRARECFRLACRLDSGLAEARIWLARVSAGLVAYGWSDDPAADAEEGVRAGLEGVRLDDGNPYAHYGLALASIYAGAIQEAIAASQRAIELSDSFALGHLARDCWPAAWNSVLAIHSTTPGSTSSPAPSCCRARSRRRGIRRHACCGHARTGGRACRQ